MFKWLTVLSLAALTSLLVACAPLNTVRPQVEKTQSVDVGNELLFAAAVDFAEAQGWQIQSADRGLGWIVALGPVDASEGMTTRERWSISTRNREVGIQLATEFLEQGQWQSVNLVCKGYSYARERQHLGTIARLASGRAHNRAVAGTPASTANAGERVAATMPGVAK